MYIHKIFELSIDHKKLPFLLFNIITNYYF